nr:hypothetical protein GCM10017745_71510 [Saccharothrix mutabilis subsp. capreolus]
MVRSLREAEGLPWEGYDVVAEGVSPADLDAWAQAGATWWIESDWESPATKIRARVAEGPPR